MHMKYPFVKLILFCFLYQEKQEIQETYPATFPSLASASMISLTGVLWQWGKKKVGHAVTIARAGCTSSVQGCQQAGVKVKGKCMFAVHLCKAIRRESRLLLLLMFQI